MIKHSHVFRAQPSARRPVPKKDSNQAAQVIGCRTVLVGSASHEFIQFTLSLRKTHITDLVDLERRLGIPITESVDKAIKGYFENRLRELMFGFHGT